MLQREKIRALIFDLFHTLTSLEVSAAPGPGTPAILGIDPELWYQHWLTDPDDYVLGLAPVELALRRIARRLNPAVTEDRIQTALNVRHKRFRHALTNIEPETLNGLVKLRNLGFKLGLISNCGIDEIAGWDDSPLAPLFQTAIFSCNVRLKKPDPAIYLLAANNLSVRPDECLYIGNGGSDELNGARCAGMTPVLITRHLEAINPKRIMDVIGDARIIIRTVNDLFLILGKKEG